MSGLWNAFILIILHILLVLFCTVCIVLDCGDILGLMRTAKYTSEIYMSLNNMNLSIVWEFHEKKYVAYGLKEKNLCKLPKAKKISYGVESLSFRGSFLWNTLDDNVKPEPTLARFKNKI